MGVKITGVFGVAYSVNDTRMVLHKDEHKII